MTLGSCPRRVDGACPPEVVAAGHAPLIGAWYRLQGLVDWELSDRARMRVSLAPELDLMTRLGNPHLRFRSVHVTGTKGKGSVCALIEAGLLNAGLRAGRYGSPHIEHVTERVSHCGQPISDSLFAIALTHALDARDAACREHTPAGDASWFDVVTAAAFWSFAEAGLDWAVVEVGIGGLLDSTNVVLPELAIVTNVALEHTEVLGTTLEAIAAQKAGIIKRGRPVLTQVPRSTQAGRVLAATSKALRADLRWIETSPQSDVRASNLALARAALVRLGQAGVLNPARATPLDGTDLPQHVALGAGLPGRLEAFDVERLGLALADRVGSTRVVLDGAHVGFAVTDAIGTLRRDPAHVANPVVLLALASDKDAADIVARLGSSAAYVICTRLQGGRTTRDPAELARLCVQHGLRSEVIDDPMTGFVRCLQLVPAGSWVLVTGSLYLAGVVRRALFQGDQELRVSLAGDSAK